MKINSINLMNITITGHEDDHIFETIKHTEKFYQIDELENWSKYLDDVKVILDVGANIGNHSIYWSRNEKIKKIIAIEPLNKYFKFLKKNIMENNIVNIEAHELRFVRSDPSLNLDNSTKSLDLVNKDKKNVTGDIFLSNVNEVVDLVKITIEDSEIDVLNGLEQTINNYKPIIWVEVSLNNLKSVLNFLNAHNYRLIEISPYNILAIHATKTGNINKNSCIEITPIALKSLETTWMYLEKNLGLVEEYEELRERYSSNILSDENRLLYEQKKYDQLDERYENIRMDMYNEKKNYHILLNEKNKLNSDLSRSQKKLKKLEYQIQRYKARKVVRISDKFLTDFISAKSIVKQILQKIKVLSNANENMLISDSVVEKHPETSKELITNTDKELSIKNIEITKSRLKKLKDIKIAVILDEFSYNSFKYEFNSIPLEPTNWLKVLRVEKPEIFLCESAWSGGAWKGKIQYNKGTERENRAILLHILDYCHANKITTIFWNKEDPTNFEKFYDTALKFDHIFTTDEESVKKYDEYGHKNVHCLMFGAQPQMFNPIEKQKRSEDIIFAGSWYTHHTKRSEEMNEILDNILDSGFKLKIYDRFNELSKKHPTYRFPDKYQEFLNPPMPHDQMEKVYKESAYSLNINTVINSKTMFARRAFELMLCNTLVLSNYSEGMSKLFQDNVIYISNNKIDLSNTEQKKLNNLYNVLMNHTYTKRFEQLLNAINYEYLPEDDTVTFYYVVNKQSEIEDIIEHFNSITYISKKLVLLLSDSIPNHHIKNIYQKYSENEISVYSLNYLLNQHETISKYLIKLHSHHNGNLFIPNERFMNNTPYFIFANLQLIKDFVEKAVLHYSYIDSKFGIALGDKFMFKKSQLPDNMLLSNENFNKAFENVLKNESNEFLVYTIQM